MTFVVLALGGNLGRVKETLRQAVEDLAAGGLRVEKISTLRTTAPVDCPPDSNDFINGAVAGYWPGSALELLRFCQRLESAAGRSVKREINAPRPLDIDIIVFGQQQISLPELIVPHPRLAERRFVLEPAAEIAPDCRVPGLNYSFQELLDNLSRLGGMG